MGEGVIRVDFNARRRLPFEDDTTPIVNLAELSSEDDDVLNLATEVDLAYARACLAQHETGIVTDDFDQIERRWHAITGPLEPETYASIRRYVDTIIDSPDPPAV